MWHHFGGTLTLRSDDDKGRQDGGRGTCGGQELLDTVHVGATVSRVGLRNCLLRLSAMFSALNTRRRVLLFEHLYVPSMYQTCLILYQEILKSNLPGGS